MNKIQPVDYNVFQGAKYQRGYGIGNVFKRLIYAYKSKKGEGVLRKSAQRQTACKRHNLDAGATQCYDSLHADRNGQV